MASVALSTKAIGATVKLKENGTLVDYIVVHKGKPSSIYDASCDGVWLLRKEIFETRAWHSSNVNDWANSTLKSYLDSTFFARFDKDIQAQIKQVKIPYRPGSGTSTTINSGASGLSCKIFLLSATEVGYTKANVNSYIPNGEGAKLDYFQNGNGTSEKIAYLNGSATVWWLRSPYLIHAAGAWGCNSGGYASSNSCANTWGVRPALILPSNLLVSDDGSVNTNTAPTTPGSITIPENIQGGNTITVTWAASTDAENNLEGYVVERTTDGGSTWSQIFQGNATSTTNTVPVGTQTVMYRVKAYDSDGLYSSYRMSAQVNVINNAAPTAPGSITIPDLVLGGSSLAVSWEAATDPDGNLTGYSLERQVDGGDWAEVYKGTDLAYTDTITRGWFSINYRVRAYDSYGIFGPYATGTSKPVDNNRAPVITSDTASGTDLGVKDAGFSESYSAGDEDGDPVTVTEAIDGVQVRKFVAGAGVENSFDVTGETFMKLLNGDHSMTITATDGKVNTTHALAFTKEVTEATITLKEPRPADAKITICVLSVAGSIPQDAVFKVEVTNNAMDDAPVWEDCTTEVKNGGNHIFENEAAEKGFAFNFRVSVKRGHSGQGGYINSVQGGFQ